MKKANRSLCPLLGGYLSRLNIRSKENYNFKIMIALKRDSQFFTTNLKSSQTIKMTSDNFNYCLGLDFPISQLLSIEESWTILIKIFNKNINRTVAVFEHSLWPYSFRRRGFFEQFNFEFKVVKQDMNIIAKANLQLFDYNFYVVVYFNRIIVPGRSFYISKRIRLATRDDKWMYVDIYSGQRTLHPPPSSISTENLIIDDQGNWAQKPTNGKNDRVTNPLAMLCNFDYYIRIIDDPPKQIPNHIKIVEGKHDIIYEDVESGARTNIYYNFNNSQTIKPNIGESCQWIRRRINMQLRYREEQISAKNIKESIENNSYHTLVEDEPLPLGWKALENRKDGLLIYLHEKTQFKFPSRPQVISEWQIRYDRSFQQLYNVFDGTKVTISLQKIAEEDFIEEAMDIEEDSMANNNANKTSNSYADALQSVHEITESNFKKLRYKFIVQKDSPLESQCETINKIQYKDFLNRIMVQYGTTEGLDYGAISSELILNLGTEFKKPENGFFRKISENSDELMIDPSNFNKTFLKTFARLIALCVLHDKYMIHGISDIFFLNLAQRKITLKDVKDCDMDTYQNMKYILDNDIDEEELGLTFCVERETKDGNVETLDLVENGSNIAVTNSNKLNYVQLFIGWHYFGMFAKHFDIMREELTSIVPLEIFSYFKNPEIKIFLCGLETIDVNDWQKNTVYKDYTENSLTIKHFWQFMHSLTPSELARIKQFTTGTSSVPQGGFANLKSMNKPMKFSIKRVPVITNPQFAWLPTTQACFHQLNVPDYQNYDILNEKMRIAVFETDSFELK